MEKKEVIVQSPLVIGEVTLVPVAQLSLGCWHSRSGFSLLGFEQPVCVLVISPSAKQAFRITGEALPLDQLTREFPDLSEKLQGI